MDPKPVQNPHIPIIVGGFSKPAMRRCARYGDGWLGFGINPEITKVLLAGIDAALAAEGRTRDDFEIIVTPGGPIDLDIAREFQALGVDRVVPLLGSDDPDEARSRIDALAEIINELGN
jgi:alkanesulfonate monooxygenase SsuD/methylene tetrahydromethanopterin reductase-like flavin-dependent oxidoreductase (luciferase family)